MRNVTKFWITLSLLALVPALATGAAAQLKKKFDPQQIVTIQGKIDRLDTITRQGRQAVNNRKTQIAQVSTATGPVVVHLGPAEFLAQQNFYPQVGDVLEITGGKVATRQGEVILATTVKSGQATHHLRDHNGIPVWTGQTPGCFSNRPGRS